MARRARFALLLALIAAFWGRSPPAHAHDFYYQIDGGVEKFNQMTSLYPKSTASSSSIGMAINNGLFLNFENSRRSFDVQLGGELRIGSVSDGSNYFGLEVLTPTLRFQFSRLYLGFGYTTFVRSRTSSQSGFDQYNLDKSTKAMIGELGFLWPITRKFSFTSSAGTTYVSQGGTKSPNPAYDVTVGMRIYFGFFGPGPGERSSAEFKGWRYPFGLIR